MTLPNPGTTGTITAGTARGQHGTVTDPQGYWIRTDTGKTTGPFYSPASFKPDTLWRSDFATGNFSEWTYEGTTAQPDLWPQLPPIRVSNGAARFEVSAADAAAGRIHAKAYKALCAGGCAAWIARVRVPVCARHEAQALSCPALLCVEPTHPIGQKPNAPRPSHDSCCPLGVEHEA